MFDFTSDFSSSSFYDTYSLLSSFISFYDFAVSYSVYSDSFSEFSDISCFDFLSSHSIYLICLSCRYFSRIVIFRYFSFFSTSFFSFSSLLLDYKLYVIRKSANFSLCSILSILSSNSLWIYTRIVSGIKFSLIENSIIFWIIFGVISKWSQRGAGSNSFTSALTILSFDGSQYFIVIALKLGTSLIKTGMFYRKSMCLLFHTFCVKTTSLFNEMWHKPTPAISISISYSAAEALSKESIADSNEF